MEYEFQIKANRRVGGAIMSNNSKGGTSGADVVFHIFMTLITGGVWLGILVVWLIIKAASQK